MVDLGEKERWIILKSSRSFNLLSLREEIPQLRGACVCHCEAVRPWQSGLLSRGTRDSTPRNDIRSACNDTFWLLVTEELRKCRTINFSAVQHLVCKPAIGLAIRRLVYTIGHYYRTAIFRPFWA
jgi:hypothetical protein